MLETNIKYYLSDINENYQIKSNLIELNPMFHPYNNDQVIES